MRAVMAAACSSSAASLRVPLGGRRAVSTSSTSRRFVVHADAGIKQQKGAVTLSSNSKALLTSSGLSTPELMGAFVVGLYRLNPVQVESSYP
jgi:hypothetical protein